MTNSPCLPTSWQICASLIALLILPLGRSYAEPGIEVRPSNLTCHAPPRPEVGTLILEVAFPNLDIAGQSPMTIESPEHDANYLYRLNKNGRIYRHLNDPTSATDTLVANLSSVMGASSPRGMSDMAFHPDFINNGELYVTYHSSDNTVMSHLARFTSTDGGASFSAASGEVLMSVALTSHQHRMDSLFFGNDGYLYIGIGDGGVPGTTPSTAPQDAFSLLGKILRINVDAESPYAIPADNPFATGGGAPEVFALGLRNPWRVSEDRVSGKILVGDVGAGSWEEVNEVVSGSNYGWPIREGAHCFSANPECDASGLVDPEFEYSHDQGCAIIGGHVYRGPEIPLLRGKYVFADYCTGDIFSFEQSSEGVVVELLVATGLPVIDFSEAPDGELYVIAQGENRLFRLAPNTSSPPQDPFPTLLTETGCFDQGDPSQVAEGVIPYGVNTSLWSDGAEKRRWMAIPDGTQIVVQADGDWEYPIGTVLIKEFSWNGSPFETRLLVRHLDSGWAGYTYEWNDSLTDAELVAPDGLAKQIDGQLDWLYPTQSQCLECHSSAAGRSLGLETAQLNGMFMYPSGITSNQLETLEHIGMFTEPLPDSPDQLPALAAIDDQSHPIDMRARSYLHANCANCHRPNGPGLGPMDFRFQTSIENTMTCNVDPHQGDLGINNAKIISPGDAASSIMAFRMQNAGSSRMPPLGTQLIDSDAATIINAWINDEDAGCPPDADADGDPDFSDPDDDNDGQSDSDEIACGSDPFDANSVSPDSDGDSVPDCIDAFPLDPDESADSDGDGTGDNADPDDDNDGQTDVDELTCGSDPIDANSMSPDADSDNVPDCVDTDDDNDGQSDDDESACGSDPYDAGSRSPDFDADDKPDCVDPDDDNDGMSDAFEIANSLDPWNPNDAGDDPDNDGLTNLEEFNIDPQMDPHSPDSDGDGIGDAFDTDPLTANNDCTYGDGIQTTLAAEVYSDTTCAARESISVIPPTQVHDGHLLLIAPAVSIASGFRSGLLTVRSADSCPGCP